MLDHAKTVRGAGNRHQQIIAITVENDGSRCDRRAKLKPVLVQRLTGLLNPVGPIAQIEHIDIAASKTAANIVTRAKHNAVGTAVAGQKIGKTGTYQIFDIDIFISLSGSALADPG